jgi:hypothetical protein|tara:strand:+ start:1569 stop:1961 length:393 start_codon:yes stop_codon:yes gene_type:complete
MASLDIKNNINAARRAKGICFQIVSVFTLTLEMTATIPRTKVILAILLPTIFPKTISGELLNAANRLTINSGRLVPNATTVKPITNAETFNFLAREIELSIIRSALLIKKNIPKKKRIYSIIIDKVSNDI